MWRLWILAYLAVSAAQPAHAEIRGLLLAVGNAIPPIKSSEAPGNDALAMATLLRARGAKDIVVLTDSQVTRSSIRAALKAMGQRSKPGDWIIFWYEGLAGQAISKDPRETDGLDEFLVLSGFKATQPDPEHFIIDDELGGWLYNFFSPSVNILQLVDAGHSGTLNGRGEPPRHFNVRSSILPSEQGSPLGQNKPMKLPPAPPDPATFVLGLEPRNVTYIGAAQDNQFALEGPLPGEGSPPRGIFTFSFEVALTERLPNGQLKSDLDQDGKLTLAELASSIEARTREISSTQQWSSASVPARMERLSLFAPAPDQSRRPIAGSGSPAVRALGPGAEPTVLRLTLGYETLDYEYSAGSSIDLAVSPREATSYITTFNVAADGTVQMLYPLGADGDGRVFAGETRVIPLVTGPPFGVDQVIAVSTPSEPRQLRAQLSALDGRKEAEAAVNAVQKELARWTLGAAVAVGELRSKP